ncbi:hypothetical protein [Capnocytophaga catalasegens]|uniref:Uncharacterized protein n=1 Tax=Capnocytophaga catalasegens TaxID=1004260 RepID=A0AAV5B002_9FLAO|nr:hypothetical protein [Capnocytophaga catalasegens]GIZ15274.1 hypothetical protein RCZ03_12740 [Capnocytophaga catalasegens]GJM51398.1 hypothetical protein RCZ15_23710 [Capnocytophaga catalasegens]GJM54206.1 hypothetical protein RCZ16_25220 [Capnocytophaga catalasegens]
MTAKDTLKQWFSNLKKPTQAHFWAWLDSFWHKSEKIPMSQIEGLDKALQNTAPATQIENHFSDNQAHKELFDIVKVQIDQIKTILNSDDTELDQLQEIVNYIKQNKQVLSTLTISNIAGLVEALADKANATHHHDDTYIKINALADWVKENNPPVVTWNDILRKPVSLSYETDLRLFLRGDWHRDKTILWDNNQTLIVNENSSYNASLKNEESDNYIVTFIKLGSGSISINSFMNMRQIAPQGTEITGQAGSSAVMIVDFVRKIQIIRIANL